VRRAVDVLLHRQQRGFHAKSSEYLAFPLERRPPRDRLPHPAEHDLPRVPLQLDRYNPGTCLQEDALGAQCRPDNECGPEYGMPRERQFGARRENAHSHVALVPWREQEDRLGEVKLPCETLHLARLECLAVDEHAELIPLQRCGREDVANVEGVQGGLPVPSGQLRDYLSPSHHRIHS